MKESEKSVLTLMPICLNEQKKGPINKYLCVYTYSSDGRHFSYGPKKGACCLCVYIRCLSRARQSFSPRGAKYLGTYILQL
jgi:hypothetical protein